MIEIKNSYQQGSNYPSRFFIYQTNLLKKLT
jgi:hypothetical protein